MNSWKARRPPACEPPFNTFWTVFISKTSVVPKPEGWLTGYRENVGLLGTSQVGDVCVERNTLLSGCGFCNGHGNTKNGVSTELLLVLGAIELVQESIDSGLVLDVDALLDQGRSDGVVDVANSLGDTLATPLGLVSIAEFAGLMGAGGGAGRDNGTVQAGLGDNVDLDGRVALMDVSIV
jgi:hypothetical protein